MNPLPGNSRSWRRLLVTLTGLALLLSALGASAASAEVNYQPADSPITPVTDPTQLQPPQVDVLADGHHLADGAIFIAPKTAPGGTVSGQQGPEIIDDEGRPIWFQPIAASYSATDFRVQRYHGQAVLTYGVGQSSGGPGHSEGWGVILDRHYDQIATVQAGNGLAADQHEFALTPQGTALITIYHQVPYDLSSLGGPADGTVLEGVVQEVDVATGNVLFEWHSLDHVPVSDSYQQLPANPATPYDYFHVNSVNLDADGNLLVSARHTWTVYKLDHHTGDVIWHLGGKESDFKLGPGVQFSWQHNALPEAGQPNTIRIFDSASNGTPGSPASRIIDVRLDQKGHTASLVRSVQHPDGLSAGSQGNAQRLPGGHLFVGWGQLGRFSELDSFGDLLWDGQLPSGYDTYRAYRSPWVGQPDTAPTAVAERVSRNQVDVEAAWNGATEVERWLVLSGRKPGDLHPAGIGRWDGLDTEISVHTRDPYVEVIALDRWGRPIGRSQAVSVSD